MPPEYGDWYSIRSGTQHRVWAILATSLDRGERKTRGEDTQGMDTTETRTQHTPDAGHPDGQALNERQFRELADRWYRETGGQSAPARVVSNEAYLAIIGMRERALPLILSDLRKHGGYWYPALRAICSAIGIAPPVIPPEARGNVARMVDAWLSWGTARGYLA